MSAPWTITRVEPREGYVLRLTFADGLSGDVDMEPRLWGPIFEPLRNDLGLFRSVTLDSESGTIVWPNGADYAPDALHDDLKADLERHATTETRSV
jgi:hypothetical protein